MGKEEGEKWPTRMHTHYCGACKQPLTTWFVYYAHTDQVGNELVAAFPAPMLLRHLKVRLDCLSKVLNNNIAVTTLRMKIHLWF